MNPTIEVVLDANASVPAYATDGAAGLDLRSSAIFVLKPLERTLVTTGLRVAIPSGFEGQVRARSGLALKKGLALVNSPGTIDSDYRGEVGVIMINLGQETVEIEAGDRIAQLVIAPVAKAVVSVVGDLDTTVRNAGGFGSTGSH